MLSLMKALASQWQDTYQLSALTAQECYHEDGKCWQSGAVKFSSGLIDFILH